MKAYTYIVCAVCVIVFIATIKAVGDVIIIINPEYSWQAHSFSKQMLLKEGWIDEDAEEEFHNRLSKVAVRNLILESVVLLFAFGLWMRRDRLKQLLLEKTAP